MQSSDIALLKLLSFYYSLLFPKALLGPTSRTSFKAAVYLLPEAIGFSFPSTTA